MARRTPQEKKSLSLKKDRRNVYGEATGASRKNIPLRKRLRNRADRHLQETLLPSFPTVLDTDEADEINSSVLSQAPKVWDKYPDAPLGEVIARKQRRRSGAMNQFPKQ